MGNFIKIECCSCGVLFAVSSVLRNTWKDTKKTFYCPNGHGQSYSKSTVEELRETIEEKNIILITKDKEISKLKKKIKPKKKKKN